MSRQARPQSASGVYHIMLRGINRQAIFEEDDDYKKFLYILQDCKAMSGFRLYAYCLMGNHVHLLIHILPTSESLAQIFKRIGVRYVGWYNRKYGRTGHLFQDRFKSEAVDDDSYLFTVLRYIHQNPVEAGLCKNAGDYPWSSYRDYFLKQHICDTDILLQMIATDSKQAMAELAHLHTQDRKSGCMDMEQQRRLSDADVKAQLLKLCGTNTIVQLQTLTTPQRDTVITALKLQGASIRQIVRLTGWSFGVVRSK